MDEQAHLPRGPLTDDPPRAETVVAAVSALAGSPCASCGAPLCGHEVVVDMVLGLASTPRCVPCVARADGTRPGEVWSGTEAYVRRRDCFLAGWESADAREPGGCTGLGRAARVWTQGPAPEGGAGRAAATDGPGADEAWDAGDMGCGDLVLELRGRLAAIRPGQVLRVTARDPGAPEDMPAWCGLTGHVLVRAAHPVYWIRRKE